MGGVRRRRGGRFAGVHDARGIGLSGVVEQVAALFEPRGYALGIVVCGHADAATRELLAGLLLAHGLRPVRRLALLQPRPGETAVRSDDATDFLRRYGHEYALVWVPLGAATAALPVDAAGLVAAAREGGAGPVVVDVTGAAPGAEAALPVGVAAVVGR